MKKILALLLAAALLFSFAACGQEEKPEETTTAAIEEVVDTTAAPVEEDTTAAVEDTTAALVEGETTAAPVEGESTTASETTTAAPIAAPQTKAEILALYNKSINDAYAAKVGFNKERMTDNEKLDAGVALQAFKGLVYTFMGVGEENKYTEDVAKGKWDAETNKHYLRKSTLTEADLTNATCKENGGKYTIVLNVKGGSSKGSEAEKYTKAPIDKCGICVGNEDKGYYDHKTGEVIYDAIAGTYAGAVIEEKYDNAKVTAVIDAATGNLVSLTVEFDIDVSIDIGIGSGTATATTHIIYKNFKY